MAVSFSLAWERALRIPGWLSKAEGRLLYHAAQRSGPWCEIGAWKGRSAVLMGSTNKGHSVDWFAEGNRAEEWVANTAGLPVTLHVGDFCHLADEIPDGLGLLFLDADHSYEGTRDAYELYAPKVKSAGWVVFHDALPPKAEWPNPDMAKEVPSPGENPWPGVGEFTKTLGPPAFCVDTCQVFVV